MAVGRFFNTEGPVNRADHYCLDPLARLDLPEILNLMEQKKYFVLHAPRQTGKTSCLLALMEYLNRREGRVEPGVEGDRGVDGPVGEEEKPAERVVARGKEAPRGGRSRPSR